MSTSQLVLNAALLVFVLLTNLGTRRVTGRRLLLPLVLVGAAGWVFLRDVPTVGGDGRLELAGALTGVALGVAAGALMPVGRDAAGALVTRAGAGYALLWLARHRWPGRVRLRRHRLGRAGRGGVLPDPPDHRCRGMDGRAVLMALAMVVTRVVVTAARARVLAGGRAVVGVMTTRSETAAGPAASWAERLGWTGPGRTSPRPRLLAGQLLALALGTVVVGALVVRVVVPGLSGTGAALAVTVLLTCWRSCSSRGSAAFGPQGSRDRAWHRPWLFAVPAVLVPVPLMAGCVPSRRARWRSSWLGYALTGFTEEALWRGVVLRVLRPAGPADRRDVLLRPVRGRAPGQRAVPRQRRARGRAGGRRVVLRRRLCGRRTAHRHHLAPDAAAHADRPVRRGGGPAEDPDPRRQYVVRRLRPAGPAPDVPPGGRALTAGRP